MSTPPSTPLGAPFEKLSIFYPMWNEEEYIERALIAGRRACERLVATGDIGDYELIVVDDASTDRTPQLADEFAAADPRVVVVHHERNRKLGGAMKTGFATASGDLVLYTDADLPFDMSELPRRSVCCVNTTRTSSAPTGSTGPVRGTCVPSTPSSTTC